MQKIFCNLLFCFLWGESEKFYSKPWKCRINCFNGFGAWGKTDTVQQTQAKFLAIAETILWVTSLQEAATNKPVFFFHLFIFFFFYLFYLFFAVLHPHKIIITVEPVFSSQAMHWVKWPLKPVGSLIQVNLRLKLTVLDNIHWSSKTGALMEVNGKQMFGRIIAPLWVF